MPSINVLRAILLVPCLVSWASLWAIAAPIPNPPRQASSNGQHHAAHVTQSHTTSPNAHPGTVHGEQVGHTAHLMGTVAVAPGKQHGMTDSDLHRHVDHIQTAISATHPDHVVHAAHKPGESHVHFHATPAPAHPSQSIPLHQAIRSPGQQNGPHDHMTLDQKNRITRGIYDKVHQPGGHPAHTVSYTERLPGVHGRGISGTLPIAHSGLKNGMTDGELHMHADWVNRGLSGVHQDRVHIHVTHKPGDDHVHFRAVPADGKDMLHPHFPKVNPLAPHHANQLNAHLNAQGNHHFPASFTGNGVGTKTFRGTIPAHNTAGMTPAHLEQYAAHAHARIVAQHGLNQQEASQLVIAATHKAGDNSVHFHSQPKTNTLLNNLGNDQRFPQLNQALTNAEHVREGTNTPWHHAELGALRESLISKGATAQTFDQHIAHHVIGVASGGGINKPCEKCHNTLVQLPVWYKGMEADTNPGIQRAN